MPFARCNTLRGSATISARDKLAPINIDAIKSTSIREPEKRSIESGSVTLVAEQAKSSDDTEKDRQEKKIAYYKERLAQNSKTVVDLQKEHEQYVADCNAEMERLKNEITLFTIKPKVTLNADKSERANILELLESKQAQLNALESASPTIKDISLTTPRGQVLHPKPNGTTANAMFPGQNLKKKNSTANQSGGLSERWK